MMEQHSTLLNLGEAAFLHLAKTIGWTQQLLLHAELRVVMPYVFQRCELDAMAMSGARRLEAEIARQ